MIPLLFLLLSCDRPANKDNVDSGPGSVPDSAPPVLDCPEDEALFREQVWQPILGDTCALCHVAGGVAGETRMVLNDGDMVASMRAATAVGEDLLLKPSGLHPDGHGGGALVAPESAEARALSFWVGWGQGDCTDPEGSLGACDDAPGQRLLRRLTPAEYDRVVGDLLDLESRYGATFAADEVVDGFDNDAEALLVSPLLAEQLRAAAEALAWEVELSPLLPCDPYDVGRANCAQVSIEAIGLRAMRRPLQLAELERYHALWELVAQEDGFDEGMRWVIAAMLQSPSFLYRSELGVGDGAGGFTLSDWELASALSFQLWGTMPDDELLALAEEGTLSEPAVLAEQAARLAADPRALEITADLVDTWLLLGRLGSVSREGLSDALRASMAAETRALVMRVAEAGGDLADLMTARETWVDPALAEHYGLDPISESAWVPLDGARYGGLLTQGSVLTTHALPDSSSPVHRGVLVREQLLCEELPPPPSNLDTSPPEVDPTLTTRERYAQHTSDPQCANCHERIDPLGFGFEAYDGLGRWRSEDAGSPVDDAGDLDGADFDGVFALTEFLLDDPRFRSCYVQTWRRWATGVEACADDPGADNPGELALSGPSLGLVDRARFTQRVGEASEGDTLAVGPRLELEDLPEDTGAWEIVELELTEVSRWGTGYCADGVVRNFGDDAVIWAVEAQVEGSINNIWNAEANLGSSGLTTFTGLDWNAELAPGGEVSFGFCADI